MFQPFSQENPLHTGTGLGLAIVNSIVKSEGVRGKVDVYSAEGLGTEIRVTIETERPSSRSTSLQWNPSDPRGSWQLCAPVESASITTYPENHAPHPRRLIGFLIYGRRL